MKSSSEAISALSEAISIIRQLPFSTYNASNVTKSLILVEMAVHLLGDAQKEAEIDAQNQPL